MKVCVCASTFQRPEGLDHLLSGLNKLTFERLPAPDVQVLIVDNDEDGGAHKICQQHRANFRWPLHYTVEPRRGLPQARNRAVAEAYRLKVDFIAFIDDDEIPEPGWLEELLCIQKKYDADGVTGPALPLFSLGTDHWLVQHGFFHPWQKRQPTGTLTRTAATNNLLLRLSVLQHIPGPFNEQLDLISGEDTLLTQQISQQGYRIVWADEAVVHEVMPPSRMRAAWIMKRYMRLSNSACHIDFILHPTFRVRFIRFAKGIARLIQGILMMPLGLVQGRAGLLRAGINLALGTGSLLAVFNRRYEEYRTIHGR